MTTAETQKLLRELLEGKQYEQRNTGAQPAIGAITAEGTGTLAVTFTDHTKVFIDIYTERLPS